jgi:hypothetical protein
VTISPDVPAAIKAWRTESSLLGLMIASIFFMVVLLEINIHLRGKRIVLVIHERTGRNPVSDDLFLVIIDNVADKQTGIGRKAVRTAQAQ